MFTEYLLETKTKILLIKKIKKKRTKLLWTKTTAAWKTVFAKQCLYRTVFKIVCFQTETHRNNTNTAVAIPVLYVALPWDYTRNMEEDMEQTFQTVKKQDLMWTDHKVELVCATLTCHWLGARPVQILRQNGQFQTKSSKRWTKRLLKCGNDRRFLLKPFSFLM